MCSTNRHVARPSTASSRNMGSFELYIVLISYIILNLAHCRRWATRHVVIFPFPNPHSYRLYFGSFNCQLSQLYLAVLSCFLLLSLRIAGVCACAQERKIRNQELYSTWGTSSAATFERPRSSIILACEGPYLGFSSNSIITLGPTTMRS
jgi:hypothetical protein